MTLGPRCKHCRMLRPWVSGGASQDCPESPTKEHEFIEPEYDTTPSPGVPNPPSDPVGRLIWDLQYAVVEVPPLDPVPTCTRSLALATAYQAQASDRQAAALERIATALERVMEETDPMPTMGIPTMEDLQKRAADKACRACGRLMLVSGSCSGCGQAPADCVCLTMVG